MFAIERRLAIAKMVNENGSVTIAELTELFGVSTETLRKDLLALEQEKVLERTHGGAVKAAQRPSLAPLQERRKERLSQKKELCAYALRYIQNGDVIAIDEGSTGAELARLIACTFTRLTVATNSLEIFSILSSNPGMEPILCGGQFIREESAFAGSLTAMSIRQMHFDKCFVFPSSISLKYGVTEYLESLMDVTRAWMERSDQIFVLAYNERFENRAARFKLTDVQSGMTFITDSGLSQEVFRMYQEQGITIIKE